jgi:hypothetical protein
MMSDDEAQRPWWQGREEKRVFEKRQQEFERRQQKEQQEQQLREAFIRRQYGAEVAKTIDIASVVVCVEDEHIKAMAAKMFVESLAKRGVQPPQLSHSDLLALGYQSIDQARQKEEHERQVEQPRAERPERSSEPVQGSRYYGALHETHRQVDEVMAQQDVQDSAGHATAGDGVQRRYAALEETHRQVAEASKPLDRSEREARDAEAQVTAGEMSDTKQARAAKLRGIAKDFERENQKEQQVEQGLGAFDMSG